MTVKWFAPGMTISSPSLTLRYISINCSAGAGFLIIHAGPINANIFSRLIHYGPGCYHAIKLLGYYVYAKVYF